MDAKLQRVEVEAALVRDDKFAIEHAFRWKLFAKWIEHFGEIAIQRFFVATLDENLIAITKHQNAEAVPLRFVDPLTFRRHFFDTLSKHGENWWVDDEIHGSGSPWAAHVKDALT